MRCAVIDVMLSFESEMDLPTPLDVLKSVVARAGGQGAVYPEMPTLVAPVQVQVPSKRLGALVSPRSWSVRSERLTDAESMFEDVLNHFEPAEDYFRDVPADSVVVSSHWIEPLTMNWDDLVQTYIRAFYRPGAILAGASDATAVFDVAREDGQDTYQSGPMQKEQLLRDFLNFWGTDEPGLPDVLLFLGHVASVKCSGPIDVTTLGGITEDAMGRAMSFGESHYAQFARSIGASR